MLLVERKVLNMIKSSIFQSSQVLLWNGNNDISSQNRQWNNKEKSGWFELTLEQINLSSHFLRSIEANKEGNYKYRGKLSRQYCVLMKNTIEHKKLAML